mmetsp:Transcript_103292/g.321902  ORF Transcript_103292/g.321902 Transcript_103292/m.321902 type:complete len:216 (-) Transcript_103292:39-686(-)
MGAICVLRLLGMRTPTMDLGLRTWSVTTLLTATRCLFTRTCTPKTSMGSVMAMTMALSTTMSMEVDMVALIAMRVSNVIVASTMVRAMQTEVAMGAVMERMSLKLSKKALDGSLNSSCCVGRVFSFRTYVMLHGLIIAVQAPAGAHPPEGYFSGVCACLFTALGRARFHNLFRPIGSLPLQGLASRGAQEQHARSAAALWNGQRSDFEGCTSERI